MGFTSFVLQHLPPPPARVVEIGTGTAWTTIALALDDGRRSIVSFDPVVRPERDRFLGRADLKADRAEGILRIRRFTLEPGIRGNVDEQLDRAASRLARVLGLERVER